MKKRKVKRKGVMITQTLVRRRQELRDKLKDHFCLPVSQRNYKDFERVVDELDDVRKKIQELKTK